MQDFSGELQCFHIAIPTSFVIGLPIESCCFSNLPPAFPLSRRPVFSTRLASLMGPSVGIMEFRKVQALRGPNVWANFQVLEVWVDLGEPGAGHMLTMEKPERVTVLLLRWATALGHRVDA